jgi:CRP-like cAMP-binding protein
MDIDFLRRIPLFMEFTDEETLTILRLCKQKALRPKEKLFEKGEPSTELYIIERGDLIAYEPFTDGSRFIYGRFGAEDVIGEMSFITPTAFRPQWRTVQMSVLHSFRSRRF